MYVYTVENGKVWSPVLDCWAEVSLPMRRLINALNEHGYVDPIRDGGRSGTFVALMERKILREAKGRAGRHYPATTPEQVWNEAYAEYDTREAADVEAEGGWGQPDGMLCTVEADRHSSDYWEATTEGLPREPAFTESITPVEQRTGVSDVQASIADEVAALRGRLIGTAMSVQDVEEALARLDRIVALVPQRATAHGLHLWQHACGAIDHAGPEQPHPDQCDDCRMFRPLTSDPWRALYTVAGR